MRLLLFAVFWVQALAVQAEALRLAYFDTELSRDGPGLLLRDILGGRDAQVQAVVTLIERADADLIVLAGIDYDAEGRAAGALNARLSLPYAHVIAPRPNVGMATGLDLDGNGRKGEARDAQGYGRFSGQGGMAILTRLSPAGPPADFTDLLWSRAPQSSMEPGDSGAAIRRLSSVLHFLLPVQGDVGALTIGIFRATPPVFDGPEDRNGRRNHDEVLFWRHLLDGRLGAFPAAPLVVMGGANLDPQRGEGRRGAIRALLEDPRLQDPVPRHRDGFAALPRDGIIADDTTVDWSEPSPGDMRVDYILPAAGLRVLDSGVLWPTAEAPLREVVEAASRHRLIWADIGMPGD